MQVTSRTLVKEIMTSPVATVGPDDSVAAVAAILIERRISGVPVVDGGGVCIGILSEADIMLGGAEEREARREQWLQMITEGQARAAQYIEHLLEDAGLVRRLMHAPVVSADENAPLEVIARLMTENRVKRIPITRGGKLVGIVTRADLVRVYAGLPAPVVEALPDLTTPAATPAAAPAPTAPPAGAPDFSAAGFRRLVHLFHTHQRDLKAHAAEEAARRRAAEVEAMMAEPYTDTDWSHLRSIAERAAAAGATDCSALRFPVALLTDGGRAVNVGEADWPATLRGKAARLYMRWRDELRPQGFRLAARIASFPDGLPGDAELILAWGGDVED